MTPEAARFLQNADKHLERGHTMLGVQLHDDAARAAYLAAFHAAQAVIFERTGRVVKTHRGVQSEFLRLTKTTHSLRLTSGFFFRKPTISKPLPITRPGLRSFQENRQP